MTKICLESLNKLFRPTALIGLMLVGGCASGGDNETQALYDTAYYLAQKGDFDGAERGFHAFLKQYPNHQLAGNAQYWLGDIAFIQHKDFAQAAKLFGEAYKKYPKHTKAPDMLYKLGASFGQLDMKDQACRTYALLFVEHPGMADRIKWAAAGDQQRLNCRASAEIASNPLQSVHPPVSSQAAATTLPTVPPLKSLPGETPTISIGSIPTTSSQVINVTGKVFSGGRITALLINGTDAPIKPDGTFSVPRGIALGNSEIRLAATDEWGQTGEATIHVVRAVPAMAEATFPVLDPSHLKAKPRPHAIALIIGIEQYKSVLPAEFAENDARSFYDYATNALGVPASRVRLLTGPDATRVDVEAAILTWLKPQVVKGQSEVFVFFAGHGLASDDGKDLYLLPQDGNRALLDRSALRRKELIDMIVDSGAKSATLFLDTCYSGGTRGKDSLVASARPILVAAKEQAVPPNVTILAAAGNDQLSSSLESAKHGLFSYFLMKGLEGDAAGSDHVITAAKLEAYLADHIPLEAAKLGRTQTPQLIGDGGRVISSW